LILCVDVQLRVRTSGEEKNDNLLYIQITISLNAASRLTIVNHIHAWGYKPKERDALQKIMKRKDYARPLKPDYNAFAEHKVI
jgi:hypothetical protein